MAHINNSDIFRNRKNQEVLALPYPYTGPSVSYTETKNVIRNFLFEILEEWVDDYTDKQKLEALFSDKVDEIERQMGAYIDYRIDMISEAMIEKLISRRFEEEVNSRVDRELKKIRGKF